ncbi:uncharacterized protein LOC133531796 isoform X2 [Cydia pomonella]|uniref:uncharacterized protein LOC133531796 isoform X2 n=1 Tax=Cydia pomonella TaxID=82600 RepID=UPI002ADD79B9|nr:uncharacterized protein LOC133531796 isoform X2 [Cydia pomonella]
MSDSLESPGCVRVKAEPLWDLSASCEPETAGPIERVVKKERDSEGDKSSWGLYNHKVKEELQNVQAGHADHDMERSGSEESNEALWGLNNDKVKEELNAHGGLIDHDIKAKGCESEEGDKPDLWSLYNDHKVKEELVLGPEEFHRPKVTLLCRAGGLSNQTCLVRLEQMQVDMERHTCSIGRNTYKFRHCFLSYEECTEESSTSNKLDAREYGVSTAPLSLRARQQLALEFSVRLERLREPPRASEPCPVTAHREPSSVEDLPGKTQHISDTDHPGTKSSRKKTNSSENACCKTIYVRPL